MKVRGRFVSIFAVFAVAGGLLPALANSVGASPSAVDEAGEVSPDAAFVADYLGVSVVEADRVMEEQERFGEAAADLRHEFPDSFAAAWVEYVPTNAFSVSFVGDVPVGAVQIVDGTGLDVSLTGGAPASERDLEVLQSDIADALAESVGKRSFSAAADAQTGTVSVTLSADLQGAQNVLPAMVTRDDVVLNYAESSFWQPEDTRGGARLISTHTNGTCTSGFSVEDSTGRGGLVMAAHCNGTNLYVHPITGDRTQMTFVDGHSAQFGDVEWYTTPDVEKASIFDSHSNDIREIHDVFQPGEFFQDQLLCVYGRTTGYGCSRIYKVNADGCGHDGRMVAMDRHITADGDSGAPWFSSRIAAGIHSGACPLDGRLRSFFTKAHLLPEALGVHVRRQ
jgi:hypothetical protein